MAWPGVIATLATAGTGALDIAAFSIANAFRRAQSERSQAIGTGVVEDAPIGTDVQLYGFWRSLQNFIYANVTAEPSTPTRFACRKDPDNAFAPFTSPAYYSGREEIPTWPDYTWGQFCESASCGTVASEKFGFRRATQWDPDVNDWTDFNDPMYTEAGGGGFGLADVGDILGPWIPVDLYRMDNELVWIAKFGKVTPPGTSNPRFDPGPPDAWYDNQRAYSMAGNLAYPALCQAAEDAWIGTIDNVGGWTPFCWTQVSWPWGEPNVAVIMRRQCFAQIIGTATHCSKECDWYVKAFLPTEAEGFDRYGDSPDGQPILEDLWALWKTDIPDQTAAEDFYSSVALARYDEDLIPPAQEGSAWASDPTELPEYPDVFDTLRGWQADNAHSAAVLRWNVDGGFTYVEPA